MATYALHNVTTGKTQGAYPTLELAREAIAKNVGPGDDWSIWEMVEGGTSGRDVETGRGPIGN